MLVEQGVAGSVVLGGCRAGGLVFLLRLGMTLLARRTSSPACAEQRGQHEPLRCSSAVAPCLPLSALEQPQKQLKQVYSGFCCLAQPPLAGKVENERFMRIALYQGMPKRKVKVCVLLWLYRSFLAWDDSSHNMHARGHNATLCCIVPKLF